MNPLSTSYLKNLQTYKIQNLHLEDEFIHPNYLEQSIFNVPSSICKLLNVPEMGSPALRKDILDPLGEDIENVIFILADAVAFHRIEKWMRENDSLVWNQFQESGVFAPLTSISPSTTSAATTTFWTGSPPAQHGIAGYEVWLREFGVTANMILHKPITYGGHSGGLKLAGFEPETFLPVEKFGTHLKTHGVEAHSFQHYSILNSGLSNSFLHDASLHGTSTFPDIWISLREMLESTKGQKTYSWVYWGDYDGSAHFFGPDDERPVADFKNFSDAFEEYFLGRIDRELKEGTVVILGADHGQITTDKEADHFDLKNHHDFKKLLHMNPTGENRLAYLHVRPGKVDAVNAYIEKAWPAQFSVLNSAEALENGLFGPGPIHENMKSRIGDLTLVAKGDAFLWWANKANPLAGRHGGLSAEEMLVPFLAMRLDGK